MKIRTIIVDDEQLARDELGFLLGAYPDVEIVGQAQNGLEAVDLIERLSPDLVLLDIQMPALDGFQVLQELIAKRPLPHIVFVTAYDHYALKAFEVNAADYLLKPVDRDRLRMAVGRVKERMGATGNVDEALERLLASFRGTSPRHLPRLAVRREGRLVLVNTPDVVYAYISDGVIYAVTDEMEGMTSYRTLEELESDLDPQVFWRVHRSYVVNIDRIAEIIPWFSGTYHLKMDDREGSEVPLSRAQGKRLRKVLKW